MCKAGISATLGEKIKLQNKTADLSVQRALCTAPGVSQELSPGLFGHPRLFKTFWFTFWPWLYSSCLPQGEKHTQCLGLRCNLKANLKHVMSHCTEVNVVFPQRQGLVSVYLKYLSHVYLIYSQLHKLQMRELTLLQFCSLIMTNVASFLRILSFPCLIISTSSFPAADR